MSLKKLFLCHSSRYARDVWELAADLRLHGIVPWVDKQGGFKLGDGSEAEARRAIRTDCFGLLLYATDDVFDRPFIRDVEIDEARRVRDADPNYVLFAIPRSIGFDELRDKSLQAFGVDLSAFHGMPLPAGADISAGHFSISKEVLDKFLSRSMKDDGRTIAVQFSTRDIFPDNGADLLRIDGRSLFSQGPDNPHAWTRVLAALRNVKDRVSAYYGRPRIYVHGSKHLTAAFLFGRVFAPFEMDIRQTQDQVWKTDVPAVDKEPLAVTLVDDGVASRHLFVELASRYKNVAAGVDAFIEASKILPTVRLQLQPRANALDVDNAICRGMAKQAYEQIELVMHSRPELKELHIFAAAPQSFMMMLAREFKAIPTTHLYEWIDGRYALACSVPGGVL